MKKVKFLSIVKRGCIPVMVTFAIGAFVLNAQPSNKFSSAGQHIKSNKKLVQEDTTNQEKSSCSDKETMDTPGSCCNKSEENSDIKTNAGNSKIFNEVCPVLGNKVNPEVKPAEYDGKLYGFCCEGCDKKFKADPKKYSKRLSEDGKKIIKK